LNSLLDPAAPAYRTELARSQAGRGAAAEDSARPLSGIVCIAIPFSAFCWATACILLHGILSR
jgi:hypothetical protein